MSVRDVIDPAHRYRDDISAEDIARMIDGVVETALKYREVFKWAEGKPLSKITERGLEAYNAKKEFERAADALLAAKLPVEEPE